MPPITALIHTYNDGARIGRTLESLRACDEFIVVDRGSSDQCVRIAREYGAIVRSAGVCPLPSRIAACPWVLCVLPTESISEALESSLYEWKLYAESDVSPIAACSMFVREEVEGGWGEPCPETRLVPRDWHEWEGDLPRELRSSMLLQGDLLRFRNP
jgi:glycosyltransferase involved in cell wall biosynthesis